MLQSLHPHERDDRIYLDEENHIYRIDQGINVYRSVTTVIKSFFPVFDPEKVIDQCMKQDKYTGMTKEEILAQWKSKGKEACSLGTLLHQSIHEFYNEMEPTAASQSLIQKEYDFFLQFHESIKKELIPYRSEWSIFDESLRIAGSIDMIYKDQQNRYHLYDWKRITHLKKEISFRKAYYPLQELADNNYNHYCLQLNLYKYILEHNYNIQVETMSLVCLHPHLNQYHKEIVPDLQKYIQRIIEVTSDRTLNIPNNLHEN